MKSPPAATDDCDDIFGPPRTYPSGYCPPKSRPSMISAKYRQKEERRKVLKISLSKLKKIEDPESSLCRSVLINNTMKRLQREARDEKLQKQQLNYPRCRDGDAALNIRSEFIKNEARGGGGEQPPQDFAEGDFDARLAEEIVNVKHMEVFDALEGDLGQGLSPRKRPFDDAEDCDVQDVLSQFYMPPTPRMLTCIDDDDEEPPKRPKVADEDAKNFVMPRYGQAEGDANPYSCGHASMFSELQNNVYHNLIASLET